jgi:hypothetical protein
MKKMEKIRYSDLSVWLKLCVIGGGISLVIWGLAFLVGFVEGFLTAGVY